MWIEVLPLLYGLFGLPLAQQRDMAGKHLKIGVFVPDAVQLLDLSPIDLFGMTTPWYLQACGLPESMVRLGVENTIHYIGMKDVGEFVNLTASASLKVTRRIGDVDVEPGKLVSFLSFACLILFLCLEITLYGLSWILDERKRKIRSL
jgi:hypothetical protein